MPQIKVEVDAKQLQTALARVPDALQNELRQALEKILRRFEREFVSTRLSGRPGLNRKSGNLARSWVREVRGRKLADLQARFATRVKYAPIHEFGGIIRPVKARFLAIPLDDARVRGIAASPRDFPDGFFMRSKGGKLLFGINQGETFVPLFVLKRSVKIPARMGLFDLWESRRADISDQLNKAVGRSLARTGFRSRPGRSLVS